MMHQRQFGKARNLLEQALDLERDEHNNAIRAILLYSLGEVELADGNATAGAELFAVSVERALAAGSAEVAAISKYGAAQAAAAVGGLAAARRLGAMSAAELAVLASPKESEVTTWLATLPPAHGD